MNHILTTERLEIRLLQDCDFNDIVEIHRIPEVTRYMLHEPWTAADAEIRFQAMKRNDKMIPEKGLCFGVVFQERVIGDVSFWFTEMQQTVEIGYAFHPEYSGRGLASEAVSALIHHIFDNYPIHRLQANVDGRNRKSMALCKRAGMRQEAYFISDFWYKGKWSDSAVFGLLREEVLEKKESEDLRQGNGV